MKTILSKLSRGKAFALVVLLAFIIHSCKKDIFKSNAQLNPQEQKAIVQEAKNWFESSYPNAVSNPTVKSNSLQGKKTWYEGLSPDWAKAFVYEKGNESLIELPLYNSKVAFVPFVTDSSKINLTSNYARTSYVISKDSVNKLRAWFMVLIADTAYVNGDFAKLNLNTYKSRDKDFSGRLLYYTPKGEFLAGWRYEKGSITKTLSVNSESLNTIKVQSKQQVNLTQVCYSYPVTAVTVTCVSNTETLTTDCTYKYTTSSVTECYYIDGGGSGGGGGGGSGGGEPFPPPPPLPPSDCPPIAVESVNGQRINLTPGGGGGGGCPVAQPPAEDDCTKMKRRKQKFADANNQTKNADVLAKPGTNEWGSDIKLNAPSLSSAYKATSISEGGADYWPPNFTWNSSDGYAIGSVHRHRANGPSPDDVFAMISNLNNADFIASSASSKSFYLNNAYSTIVSGANTYVVTVSNWGILDQMYSQFNADQTGYRNSFSAKMSTYVNAGLSESSASIQAFEDIFNGAVTLYQAPAGSTGFAIVGIDANGNVKITYCP